MAYISELYCSLCDLENPTALRAPITPICPMSGAICDGGGNRHQTAIKVANHPEIGGVFVPGHARIVPSVCSITYDISNQLASRWIVCPRRLFAGSPGRDANREFQSHEVEILVAAGLPRNVRLGVWAEVYLRENGSSDGDENILNYHFDYVIAPVADMTVGDVAQRYGLSIDDLSQGLGLRGRGQRQAARSHVIVNVPILDNFIIVEVMTASTSGSDTERGTNISSAFINAIMGRPCPSPGINRRQVWGRMATQLFAKSCLAEAWGGKTIWVLQDALMREIFQATGVVPENMKSTPGKPKINIASMRYANQAIADENRIVLDRVYSWDAGVNPTGSGEVTDILLPARFPDKAALVKCMMRRKVSGTILL